MSVTNQDNQWPYNGDGVTANFAYDNLILEASDLLVYVNGALQMLTTDYTVTGIGQAGGGNVVFVTPPPGAGSTPPQPAAAIVITSAMPETQQAAFTTNSPFATATVMAALDKLTRLAQQLRFRSRRSVRLDDSDSEASLGSLPPKTTRINAGAGSYLGFDGVNGDPTCLAPPVGTSQVSAAMVPVIAAATLSAARQALGGNKTLDDVASTPWAAGDMVYFNGADLTRLAQGAAGALLQTPAGGGAPAWVNRAVVRPQGRLTLQSAKPIMNADVVGAGTIYYTPYIGASCPIYDGAKWNELAFAETQLILDAAGAPISNLFDVFAYNNGGAFALGFGPSWSTGGGSNSARGAGAGSTALMQQNGLWVNANAIVLRNNSVNSAAIAVGEAIYLGTFYTTAAGQTAMQFSPAPTAGGSNAFLALWNAYNREHIQSQGTDNTGGNWTYASTTWRPMNASNSNRISWVDGLARSPVCARENCYCTSNGLTATYSGMVLNSTTATPKFVGANAMNGGSVGVATASSENDFDPSLGLNFAQAMESAQAGSTASFVGVNGQTGYSISLEM